MMTDKASASDDKPELDAIGQPLPKTGQPVEPHQPGKPMGERQDGAGAGPNRPERNDAVPVGSTAMRHEGHHAGARRPDEPGADHRGQPARFASGAASGSGSGAGGGGTGMVEEPDPDSAGGDGRERGFAASRQHNRTFGDGRKHGGC